MLVDTHAHLYWESYKKDLDQVIKHALEAEVSTIVNVGVDVRLSKVALQQTKDKPAGIPSLRVYSTIGIHPHEAHLFTQGKLSEEIGKLEQVYLRDPKSVVAVGECGLDFFFQNNPGFNPNSLTPAEIKNKQRSLFQAQIDLAKKLNLPLLIHCRDDRSQISTNSEAWDEVLEMIKDHFGILHCYSGFEQTTKKALKQTKFLISFAGNITYPKNDYLRQAAKIVPLDRICLETDSPFLSPQSKRGQRNEPSSVREIAQLITDLKGISLEQVATQSTNNVKIVFNL